MAEQSDRPRISLATRIRVWLSLGIALGLGSVGTMALWSSTATAHPAGPVAGVLDVTVNGGLGGAANRNGTRTEAGWTMKDLLPGEQQAISVTVGNTGAGNIPVDFRLSAYASGVLGPALRVTVFDGGTPTNPGGALPAAYRTATCQGGTLVGTQNQLFGTTPASATVLDASKQTLAVSQTHTYCVIVAFDDSAANRNDVALRDAKATLFFVVKGTQLGAAP
jgi:predicted ribosomally synthesized peptide with SipW-like signal peptide